MYEKLTPSEIEIVVKSGPQPHPRNFPNDVKKFPFPVSILKRKQQNSDVTNRDWLVWVKVKMHCFVFHVGCKPFSGHLSSVEDGWSSEHGWKSFMIEYLSMRGV